jgi:hypothetical protein
VFDPNPVAVLNDTSLKDKSPIPMNAYTEVDVYSPRTKTWSLAPSMITGRSTLGAAVGGVQGESGGASSAMGLSAAMSISAAGV